MPKPLWRTALSAGVVASLLYQPVVAQVTGRPPPANEVRSAPPPEPRRQRARSLELPLPLRIEQRDVGTVPVRIEDDRLTGVEPRRLAEALRPFVDEATIVRLDALAAGYITLEQVKDTGIDIAYDPAALTIDVTVPPERRSATRFGLTDDDRYEGYVLVEPSDYALGVDTDLALSKDLNDEDDDISASLIIDGFANVGGIDGVYADFRFTANLVDDDDDGELLARDRITLFKDDRERAIRYSAVDVALDTLPLTGETEVIGVGFERRFNEIQPENIIRSLGSRSFALDRRATVEVQVNGASISRFVAGPGRVDLDDIPFVDIGNDVVIIVEDETGTREIDRFSFSTDEDLLAQGVSEFGASLGFVQEGFEDGFDIDTDQPALQGYYRLGLTPEITAGVGAFISDEASGATVNVVAAVPYGVAQADLGASVGGGSEGDDDAGYAAQFSYTGTFDGILHGTDQFDLRFSYESGGYRTLRAFDASTEDDTDLLSASASYRFSIDERTALSFGAGYSDTGDTESTRLTAGVSRSFGRVLASLNAVHEMEGTGDTDDTSIFLSLSMPLGERTRGRLSYASPDTSVVAEVSRSDRNRVGNYGYRLRAERDDDDINVQGSVNYVGNRYDASASLFRSFGNEDNFGDDDAPMIATARIGTGIAITDSAIGIGRDVSRGFVIVDPHPTLDDATVAIEDRVSTVPLSRADRLGPAVVPLNGDYRVSEFSVDIQDAPIGYDFGSGAFATQTGARSGVSVTVGSDAFRSARGAILDIDGAPVALRYGRVLSAGGETIADIFTNRAGIFIATGLRPGSYRLEIDGLSGSFTVDEDSTALIELGTLILR